MKKLIFLVALVCATTVRADVPSWERYAQSGDTVRYFDKFRRVVMSGMAFVWDLHDLVQERSEGSKAYQSVLYPTEYNCRTVQKRVLSVHKMSGRMGGGEAVIEDSVVGAWTDVLPGSPEDRLMVSACQP